MFEDPMDAVAYVAPIIRAAEAMNPRQDGDYLDEEGLLMCGKCHTRRQTVTMLPDPTQPEGARKLTVMIQCRCRKEADAAEERRRQQEKDMDAIKDLRKQSLMDKTLLDARFESFQQTESNTKAWKVATGYVRRFDDMLKNGQGIVFYGPVGTGKTFAAACIANALMDKKTPVVMTSFIKLLDAMQSDKTDSQELIGTLNRAKLLILDDLGVERETSYATEKVYDIIDSRIRAGLPLIITTNIMFEEMKTADEKRYERIYDRLFGKCFFVEVAGKSWRKKEANRMFVELRELLEGENG